MLNKSLIKFVLFMMVSACGLLIGLDAFAASSGIGSVASQAMHQLGAIAQLITAGSYVAGMGFAVAAVVKFKTFKDAPTQTHIGQPIVLLFVAAALIFIPSVYSTTGASLFASGAVGGISGIQSFSL